MKRIKGFRINGVIFPDGWKYALGPLWLHSKYVNAKLLVSQRKVRIRTCVICSVTTDLLINDIHRIERKRSIPSCGHLINIFTYSSKRYTIAIWNTTQANLLFDLLQKRLTNVRQLRALTH